MNPMIIIGCGGSGGKTVVGLRRVLESRLRQVEGWGRGIPDSWQLLWIDTLETQDPKATEFGNQLPKEDYISLASTNSDYLEVHNAVMSGARGKLSRHQQLNGWVPPSNTIKDMGKGAGQLRALGRMANLDKMGLVGDRIEAALTKIQNSTGELDLLTSKLTGGKQTKANEKPFVVVISSLAGGTGAGIFLDVCDIAKVAAKKLENNVISVLYSAEIFKNIEGPKGGFELNTVAAISELTNSYLRPKDRSAQDLFMGAVDVQEGVPRRHGPDYPFIIGLKDLNGVDLDSPNEAYRAVTETLASVLLDPKISAAFTTELVGNWQAMQENNTSRWKHHNNSGARSEIELNGVVSSFGSARLSLGLELFGDYSAHRLAGESFSFIATDFMRRARQEMQDPSATRDQVLSYYSQQKTPDFLKRAGFGESSKFFFDLEALTTLIKEVIDEKKGDADWTSQFTRDQLFQSLSQKVEGSYKDYFKGKANKAVFDAQQKFISESPEKILTLVSEYLATYGLPVALMLVGRLRERVAEILSEINKAKLDARYSDKTAAEQRTIVLASLKPKDRINSQHSKFREVFVSLMLTSLNEVRRSTIDGSLRESYEALNSRFLATLEDELIALESDFAVRTTSETSDWPSGVDVPVRFRPSPLDFCLIEWETWPSIFDANLTETVSRDESVSQVTPLDYVRGQLGKTGIQMKTPWVMSSPPIFSVNLTPANLLEQARKWLERRGYPFGDFLHQSLLTYLADSNEIDRAIVDRQARREQFYIQLQRAIKRALPLAHVPGAIFHEIHDNAQAGFAGHMASGSVPITLEAEKIPLAPSDDPNSPYQRAKAILLDAQGVSRDDVSSYFDPSRSNAEGILFVYRLSGAIHPAAIASLAAPIAAMWRTGGTDKDTAYGLKNRRARRLKDFVALRPSAIDAMCRGWILGRSLGLVSFDGDDANENGITIARYDRERERPPVRVTWPLLGNKIINFDRSQRRANKVAWLGGLLESTSLAQMLYATNNEATIGHEALYLLGTQHGEILRDLRNGLSFPIMPSGSDGIARISKFVQDVEKNLKFYQVEVKKFERARINDEFDDLARDTELHPEDPFQSELYELLVEPCKQLLDTASKLAESEANSGSLPID